MLAKIRQLFSGSKKKRLIMAAAIFVLVCGGIITYAMMSGFFAPKPPVYKTDMPLAIAKESPDTKPSNQEKLSKTYGPVYDKHCPNVQDSKPLSWDKSMLDKAYFCVFYTEKTGAYTTAREILSIIQYVGKRKVLNIDDNSWDITQVQRDDMMKRYNQAIEREKTLKPVSPAPSKVKQ